MSLLKACLIIMAAALWDVLVLFLGIVLPMAFLLFELNQSAAEILNIIQLTNAERKVSELMLILVPLGTIYCMNGLLFAYKIGRPNGHPDTPTPIFVCGFLLPAATLLVVQAGQFYYIYVKADMLLKALDCKIAGFLVTASIVCLLTMELFMAITRARKEV